MFENSPSKSLHQYGQYQKCVQICTFIISSLLCLRAELTETYVLPPSTYGNVVTSVAAEYWCYPLMVSSLIYLVGIQVNGLQWWTPYARMFGAVFQSVILGTFFVLTFDLLSLDTTMIVAGIGASANLFFSKKIAGDICISLKRPKDDRDN